MTARNHATPSQASALESWERAHDALVEAYAQSARERAAGLDRPQTSAWVTTAEIMEASAWVAYKSTLVRP